MTLPNPQYTVSEIRSKLHKLEYWFDVDEEILDAMDADERRVHLRMHGFVLQAIELTKEASAEIADIERKYVFKLEASE